MDKRMKYYDMDCPYPSNDANFKLTLSSLCEEIIKDCYTDEKIIIESSVRDKIKNSKKSGLIDRLKKQLNFDIEAISKGNKNEIFDEYKLLKLLYLIEHKGFSYNEKEYGKFPVIDLLSNPRLENVHTVFSVNDHYGDTYEYLCNSIAPFVKDIEKRCKLIQQVSSDWEKTVLNFLYFFVSDIAIDSLWNNIFLLDRVYYYLKEIIEPLLKTNIEENHNCYKEGVLNTFYNILICYYFKCNENDRIINASNVQYVLMDLNYIEKYKMYDNIFIPMEFIEDVKKFLLGKHINNSNVNKFMELIFYKKEFTDDYVKNVLYALDHVESYWEIVKKAKNASDSEMCLGILVSIVQEIIYIKETKPQIINTFLGHENAQKSLLRIISSPNKENGIGFQVLRDRLENRVSINTGGRELIVRARIIQKEIYRIKKLIFSYQNIEDIIEIHNIIHTTVVNLFKMGRIDTNILKMDLENQLSAFFEKTKNYHSKPKEKTE